MNVSSFSLFLSTETNDIPVFRLATRPRSIDPRNDVLPLSLPLHNPPCHRIPLHATPPPPSQTLMSHSHLRAGRALVSGMKCVGSAQHSSLCHSACSSMVSRW
ncbi:hypothetical protein SISSUDRAFT_533851 [Sistotremastrum suecicum HHB10207 ss-3]|uniref:Uncharacterized protein n=1 Tax=Sistotremastrum suecicum HHB10207 ss-3 TaxID=1314776 RepID=A0A165XSQ9_9AGAM|nr:hypothetical protein SISSUDRAFT_533851 [Sistotremastrum suecicum HHB10207 ss-3]